MGLRKREGNRVLNSASVMLGRSSMTLATEETISALRYLLMKKVPKSMDANVKKRNKGKTITVSIRATPRVLAIKDTRGV
jgi:hypothetical protein